MKHLPLTLLCLVSAPLHATEPLRLVTWNVESGGNDPAVIAQQLAELGPYDLYGLTEVSPANTRRYTAAIGDSYKSLVSATGRSDRMMIVYNADSCNCWPREC